MKVHIEEIRVPARRRALDDTKVHELAESIASLGLLQPIGIRPDKMLVFGWHCLEACKLLGWEEIDAVIIEPTDENAFSDLDGIVERNGHFLILEGKRIRADGSLASLSQGQERLYRALWRTGLFTIVIFWGQPPRGLIYHMKVMDDLGCSSILPASQKNIMDVVQTWWSKVNVKGQEERVKL